MKGVDIPKTLKVGNERFRFRTQFNKKRLADNFAMKLKKEEGMRFRVVKNKLGGWSIYNKNGVNTAKLRRQRRR